MSKFKAQTKRVLEEISYTKNTSNNLSSNSEASTSSSDIEKIYSDISINYPLPITNVDFNLDSSPQTNLRPTNMADALRSTVTLLKNFDGTPSRLEFFLNQIDTFHSRYFNNDLSQQEYVMLAIRSKIVQSAEDFLLTRPDLKTWPEIKLALQQKFSDPITRANLQQQLIFLSRKNESTQDYIQKLKALVTKVNTKICTEVQNAEARAILISQNELTATQNLLANISSELRTLLIVQNPQNLENAIEIINNYEVLTSQTNFKNNYIQNHSKFNNKSSNQTTHNPFTKPMQHPHVSNFAKPFNGRENLHNSPMFQPRFQSQPQRTFKPPNQPSTSNQQRPPFKQSFPQPMSGVSTINRNLPQKSNFAPQRPFQSHFQKTGNPNFTFQELTHVESEENRDCKNLLFNPNDEFNENYYPENFDDESSEEQSLEEQMENFQLQASEETNVV